MKIPRQEERMVRYLKCLVKRTFGDYVWETYGQIAQKAEYLAKAIIDNKFDNTVDDDEGR